MLCMFIIASLLDIANIFGGCMKKCIRFGFIILLLAFLSCNNNVQNGNTPQKKEKISITSVTLEGKNCEKDGTVEVSAETAELVVNFAGAYENLTVKVGNADATITGKRQHTS